MKLSIDDIRDKYVEQGYSYGRACGASFRDWKNLINDFLIEGGSIAVFYGAPGSGKSTLMGKFSPADNVSGLLDITGLNVQQNAFLLRLPRDRISFVQVRCPYHVCVGRIKARPARPLSAACEATNGDSNSYLIALTNRWFSLYNDDTEQWQWKLPVDSVISFVPNKEPEEAKHI